MDNLNKLDFEVSYDTPFSPEGRDLINIYSEKVEMIEAKKEEDKLQDDFNEFYPELINFVNQEIANKTIGT